MGRLDPVVQILPRLERPAANGRQLATQNLTEVNVGFREGLGRSPLVKRPGIEWVKSAKGRNRSRGKGAGV